VKNECCCEVVALYRCLATELQLEDRSRVGRVDKQTCVRDKRLFVSIFLLAFVCVHVFLSVLKMFTFLYCFIRDLRADG